MAERFYLKEWRKHRGLTQEQLAARMDVDRTTISKMETGTHSYTKEFLENAANALNCQPWELIGRNPMIEPEPVVNLWERIMERDRPAALTMLRSLAGQESKKNR